MTDILRELLSRLHDDSWIIDNNLKILKDIVKINNAHSSSVTNIKFFSYDFGTLYTSLPHQDLKEVMACMFEELIEDEIVIYKFNKKFTFDLDSFKTLLNFLLDSSYINFDNTVYRQNKGIPMGESYSPMLANIYLHYFENSFKKNSSD